MKTLLTIIALTLGTTIANAGVFCGANQETTKGSHQYDKLIFAEMVDTSKGIVAFLKPDGKVLRHSDTSSVFPTAIGEGDVAIYVTFPNEKVQLVTAKVKRDPVKMFDMTDMALSISGSGKSMTLLSNGIAITCTEN